MVVRRGGSQDYILGGSAQNSRALLRAQSGGSCAGHAGGWGGKHCPHRQPTRLPRLEHRREKGIRGTQREGQKLCTAVETRNPSGKAWEGGMERGARQQLVKQDTWQGTHPWHRQSCPLPKPAPSQWCCSPVNLSCFPGL